MPVYDVCMYASHRECQTVRSWSCCFYVHKILTYLHIRAQKVIATILIYISDYITYVAADVLLLIHLSHLCYLHFSVLPFHSHLNNGIRGGSFFCLWWLLFAATAFSSVQVPCFVHIRMAMYVCENVCIVSYMCMNACVNAVSGCLCAWVCSYVHICMQ
jgi:hypothetical protein